MISTQNSTEKAIEDWISQFRSTEDKELGRKLLSNIINVSSDDFVKEMSALIKGRLSKKNDNVGLYIETERQHRNCKTTGKRIPNRLFEEKGTTHKRAIGSGPPTIATQNNPKKEVGSEGILAQLATEMSRISGSKVCINPGPDRIRNRRNPIRRFILLTDFVGSGNRVYSYLEAAWRVRSVRSWWSRRARFGLSFEVLAYSATEPGLRRVNKHPCRPLVSIVRACPTIGKRFTGKDYLLLTDLCRRYTVDDAAQYCLGYEGVAALIAFHHGIPNNAPGIFWYQTPYWTPLYPKRITDSLRHTFSSDSQATERTAATLEALGLSIQNTETICDLTGAAIYEVLVLSSLNRSPRTIFAISARSGIDLLETELILFSLKMRNLIDESHRLTVSGRTHLTDLKIENKAKVLPTIDSSPYYPTQLRAPRKPSKCL